MSNSLGCKGIIHKKRLLNPNSLQALKNYIDNDLSYEVVYELPECLLKSLQKNVEMHENLLRSGGSPPKEIPNRTPRVTNENPDFISSIFAMMDKNITDADQNIIVPTLPVQRFEVAKDKKKAVKVPIAQNLQKSKRVSWRSPLTSVQLFTPHFTYRFPDPEYFISFSSQQGAHTYRSGKEKNA